MNYYEHHLGDYAKDTGHLTMLEHGAYRMLLDRYYGTEQGIPADQAHRVARARTRDERTAVDAVLAEFFTLEDGIWRNSRAEQEIEKAHARISAAKENGKKGGRPKKQNLGSEKGTQEKPSGFPLGSENETQEKAHQAPSTKHQLTPKGIAGAVANTEPTTSAGAVCARLKQAGILDVNPSHPKLLALLGAGLTAEEIVAIGPEAKAKGKGFHWVLAAAEGRRRDAANVGKLPDAKSTPWFMSSSAIEAKAEELGVVKKPDEHWTYFRDRVYAEAGVTDEMVRKAKIDAGERV